MKNLLRLSTLSVCLLVAQAQDKITVSGSQQWVDSKLDVTAGETIRLTASGSIEYPGGTDKSGATKSNQVANPGGLARGFRDLVKTYPVNGAGRGAVIARVGDAAGTQAFLVGNKWEGKAPITGRLFLGINQGSSDKAEGSFEVTVERVAPAPAPVDASKLNLPSISQDQLNSIPRRVKDPAGTEGDRVNFVIIGSQKRLQDGLKAAGWVVVDKDKKSAVLAGVMATIKKESYVTLPMSELMLFGRVQDFGYAQGDPLKVVASRHHFRIWKAPFDLNGTTVWAGAGTHDIGFDRDQRNNGLTHKIDPDTDKEREYIGQSLQQTGNVAKIDYMTPADTITKAKTAHGEEFFSDGRIIIITLLPD